jgi:hypothetical protein
VFPVKQVCTAHHRRDKDNPTGERIDVAKRLVLPTSNLNSIIAKTNEIREQADKHSISQEGLHLNVDFSVPDLEIIQITVFGMCTSIQNTQCIRPING